MHVAERKGSIEAATEAVERAGFLQFSGCRERRRAQKR
jgi:hypothetical protein